MMVNAIDSLVTRQLVVEERDGWRRDASHEAIARALPETLGEVITRHVDHLDPVERESLEAAAAVGLEFAAASVAAALEQRVEHVRRVLGPLARRGHLIVAAGATDHPARHRRRTGSGTPSMPTSSRSRLQCCASSESSSD